MCYCGESIEPPNSKIKMCRHILQILALGMVGVIIASAVAGAFNNMITSSILIMLLYCSWTQFNWFILVFFCIYCAYQIVQILVILTGLIQHQFIFTNHYMSLSVIIVLELVYFPIALYFSHYAYKNFKNLSLERCINQVNRLDVMEVGNDQNLQQSQAVMGEAVSNATKQQQKDNFSSFEGSGVRII